MIETHLPGDGNRPQVAIGALWSVEMITVHIELILFCLSTKNRVVVQYQAVHVIAGMFFESICRAQAGKTAAYYDQVEGFTGIFRFSYSVDELPCSYRMGCIDNLGSISVAGSIVAYAAGTGPLAS